MPSPEEIAKETCEQFACRIREKQKRQVEEASKNASEAYVLIRAIKNYIEEFTDDLSNFNVTSIEFKIRRGEYTKERSFVVYPAGHPHVELFRGNAFYIHAACTILSGLVTGYEIRENGYINVQWNDRGTNND